MLLERAAAMGSVFWLGGLIAIHRQTRVAARRVGGRRGARTSWSRPRSSSTDLVERDYVLRLPDSTFAGRRGVRLQAQPGARGARAPDAARRRARRHHRAIAEWLAFRRERGRQRGVPRDARPSPREGRAPCARGRRLRPGGRGRAIALRERQGGGALREGPRRSSSECDHVDEDLRLKALHHHGDVLQPLGRNDEAYRAFVEMLDARVAARSPRARGARRTRASGASIARRGGSTRRAGSSRRRSRSSGRPRTSAASRARSTTSASSTGSRATTRSRSSTRARSLAMRRKHRRPRAASRVSLNNLGLVQQDSGDYKARARSVRAGAAHPARDRRPRRRQQHAQQPRDRCAGHAATTSGRSRSSRRRTRSRRRRATATASRSFSPTSARRTTASATRRRPSRSSSRPRTWPTSSATSSGSRRRVRGLGKAYLARREYTKARECTQRAVELLHARPRARCSSASRCGRSAR